MRRKIILIPEALLDAENAYDWYEEQDAGLGEEFLRCLEAAYAKISESPEHYPVRFDSFRRILIRRFPYAVYSSTMNQTCGFITFFTARSIPTNCARD